MARKVPSVLLANGFRTTVLISFLLPGLAAALMAKEKTPAVDPNDPTLRLFHLIDNSYGGKLAEFYILADIYKDQKNPNEELQRVLRVEYDKSRAFGKLSLYVRTVGKMQPDQAKAYTPKMVYEFGVADAEKFVKTEPGPFGKTGDLYLRSVDDRPLASSPVTESARQTYERLLNDHILPALQKKQ